MSFGVFEEVLVILVAALAVALAFSRLRLPSIVAYIVAGALIGPHLLGWVADPSRYALIAEFGVVFLLFSLGLEFSLPRMIALRGPVFGLGGAQVLVSTGLFTAAVYAWGATLEAAVVIAGALALSSTAIVTRELSALQQFDARYAQLSIAVLLFQDLVAVVFLILVPVLGGSGEGGFVRELGSALFKGGLLLAALMAAGKYVLPRVYHEVARTRSEDVFVLTTLVIALLAAWLTHAFALSMALGGFVIGMMLGEGPFKHQIDTEIRPFKDVLLGLFFVTVGMSVDVGVVAAYWLRIVAFTLALLALNLVIVAALVRVMGEHRGSALRVGLTLAQAGEFGLALLVIADLNGVVPRAQVSFIIAIAILSMLVSPLLIRHVDRLAEALLRLWPGQAVDTGPVLSPVLEHSADHVVIGGFGRVGQTIAHLLRDNGIPYIGIDMDSEVVRRRRALGENVVFGDSTRIALLEQCHLETARLAILTFRSPELAKRTIAEIRKRGVETPIIVRCYESSEFEELISLGADRVIPEMLEASLVIGAHVLSFLDIDEAEVNRQVNALRSGAPPASVERGGQGDGTA